MGIIADFSFFQLLNASFDWQSPLQITSLVAGYSQLISNVPATLLLADNTDHWKYLAWDLAPTGC